LSEIVLVPGGPRPLLLIRRAYEEEGLPWPDIDERVAPTALVFPRSFVEAAADLPGDKAYDYSFMGSLYRPELRAHRAWVLDFVRERFTERSYLLSSDDDDGAHPRLGGFDHTGQRDGVFVPKEVPEMERDFFNPAYFGVLRRSQFALCPAGDLPWSLRFFEAVMCKAMPVVVDPLHTGRNELERAIGYNVCLADSEHVYDEDAVEENYRRFLRHQTLIDRNGSDR
jgi:hypothetical protein